MRNKINGKIAAVKSVGVIMVHYYYTWLKVIMVIIYYLTKISFMVIMVILVIDCYLAIKTWLSWLLNYPTETSMLCRGNVVMILYLFFG